MYKNSDEYFFMDNTSFEQITLNKNQIDFPEFLIEGKNVEISIHTEKNEIINCELPSHIESIVISSEPGVKGDTATNATKTAKIENDIEIQVPLFINENDKIKVDIKLKKYVERVK